MEVPDCAGDGLASCQEDGVAGAINCEELSGRTSKLEAERPSSVRRRDTAYCLQKRRMTPATGQTIRCCPVCCGSAWLRCHIACSRKACTLRMRSGQLDEWRGAAAVRRGGLLFAGAMWCLTRAERTLQRTTRRRRRIICGKGIILSGEGWAEECTLRQGRSSSRLGKLGTTKQK